MLNLRYGRRFKKEFRQALQKPGNTIEKFTTVLKYLVNEKPLPPENKDHKLSGEYVGYRECHLAPDWLLIYRVEREVLTLVLSRTGSHSDLF